MGDLIGLPMEWISHGRGQPANRLQKPYLMEPNR